MKQFCIWLFISGLTAAVCPAGESLNLPDMISDHMVLQAGIPASVFGTAAAGQTVTVKFADQTAAATAEKNGRWKATFEKPLKPGLSGDLTVTAGNETKTVKDVLTGEVWFCSGQSNMEYYAHNLTGAKQIIAESANNKLRLFKIEKEGTAQPAQSVRGQWVISGPKTVPMFSGAAYLFGRDLQKQLDQPVGLIQSTWGGTIATSWTPLAAVEKNPTLAKRYVEPAQKLMPGPANMAAHRAEGKAWTDGGKKGPQPISPTKFPGRLFNGMVKPATDYTIRGVFWYQGESDAYSTDAYRISFPMLIASWREAFGQKDLPFIFVQLPGYKKHLSPPPRLSHWAKQRDVQTDIFKTVPHTYMVVSIDLGEENIHPKNKTRLVPRVLNAALANVYGKKIPWTGPIVKTVAFEDGAARVSFDYLDGKLKTTDGGPIKGFAVVDEKGNVAWADAKIDGETVVVTCKDIPNPAAVQYGWQEMPVVNLTDETGLPACPFRIQKDK